MLQQNPAESGTEKTDSLCTSDPDADLEYLQKWSFGARSHPALFKALFKISAAPTDVAAGSQGLTTLNNVYLCSS
jgi:hypothetical protein